MLSFAFDEILSHKIRIQTTNNQFKNNDALLTSVLDYYFSNLGKDLTISHSSNHFINNSVTYLTSQGAGVHFGSEPFVSNDVSFAINIKDDVYRDNSVYLGNYGSALSSSMQNPGKMVLENVVFENNYNGAKNACCGNGGAVSIAEGFKNMLTEYEFREVKFIKNSASQNGGAVLIHSLHRDAKVKVDFIDSLFDSNVVRYSEESSAESKVFSMGGGIHVAQMRSGNQLSVNVIGCVVQNNAAPNGGFLSYVNQLPIYVEPYTFQLTINDSIFHDNKAMYKGGVLYLVGNLEMFQMKNNSFVSNEVTNPNNVHIDGLDESLFTSDGGCIYYDAAFLSQGKKAETGDDSTSNTIFESVKMINNSAGDVGGALYFKNAKNVRFSSSCSFERNFAEKGGAGHMYLHQNEKKTTQVQSTQYILIEETTTWTKGKSLYGGGMVLDISNWKSFDGQNQWKGTIQKNEGTIGGGGVYFVHEYLGNIPEKEAKGGLNVSLNIAPIEPNFMTMPNQLLWNSASSGTCEKDPEFDGLYHCSVPGTSFQDGYNQSLSSDAFQAYVLNIRMYSEKNSYDEVSSGSKITSSLSFDLNLLGDEKSVGEEQTMQISFYEEGKKQVSERNITFTYTEVVKPSEPSLYMWVIIISISMIMGACIFSVVVIILVHEYYREYSPSAQRKRSSNYRKRKGYIVVNDKEEDNMIKDQDDDDEEDIIIK